MRQVPQQPLKVARYLDIHRGTERRSDVPPLRFFVASRRPESLQNVILVRGDDQLRHRQAQALGIVAGEDVAKVARRHHHLHAFRVARLLAQGKVRRKVVRDLRENAGPVDTVDRTEVVLVVKGLVGKQRLDNVLAIVKRAVDSEIVHIVVQNGRHLRLLDRRDTAAWVQDEDVDMRLGPQAGYGRAARIATRGAEHSERVRALGLVATLEYVLEQVAEQLQRHVLESKRRAVPQLQAPFAGRDLVQRRHVVVTERGIRLVHEHAQIVGRNAALFGRGRHEQRRNPKRQLRERQRGPRVLPVGWQRWYALRHIETAVRRKTLQDGLFKREALVSATCAQVLHGGTSNAQRLQVVGPR